MKQFRHIAALGVLAFSACAAYAAPTNLLKAPSTFDEGWAAWNDAKGSASVADGVLTLAKTDAQDGDFGKYQNVTLEAGKSYSFVAQYRTSGANTNKTQFAGFWKADAGWEPGAYADLATAAEWTTTTSTYVAGDVNRCIILASNNKNHTVEYKNVWLVETPTVIVKVNGAEPTGDLEPGAKFTIESNVADFDLYYLDADNKPVKYEAEATIPNCANLTVYADLEGAHLGEKNYSVKPSKEYYAKLYEESLKKYEYIATDYPDASAESLAVFSNSLGNDATIEDYQNAIAAMENISSLRAVVETHAVAAGNKKAVDMTSKIVNPCANSNTDGWTLVQSDGNGKCVADNREGELPTLADGSKITTYFDGGDTNWGEGDWTNRLEQTINLPKGKYRIAMFGRGSDQCRWHRLIVSDKDVETQVIAEQGDVAVVENGWYKLVNVELIGADNGIFGKGWNNYNIDFEVNPAEGENEDVKITVAANAQAGSQWYSFTNFRLTQLADGTQTGIDAVEAAEDADAPYYDLQGRRVINPEKGIYIRNGKKIVVR